ncbi:hypothetical protein [Nocardioides sp. Soil796]|uniref:hypothetical protein n=1 Tax=Nocardioides sp. Soil796 TaxID=1736412 RepID=UPI00070BF344|nr:hypothetical protein [Nocardioides sp. Soil796]KRF14402.1 hypothetical protein ASH02_08675 [Nocardioides sp. Soil796]
MRAHIATLVAAVLIPLVSGCSSTPFDDGERDARVGEVFAVAGEVEGHPVDVVLPVGSYDFVVSSPHEETGRPAAVVGEEVSPKAADGRAFVDVGYARHRMDGDVWMLQPQGNEPVRFWLEYDGKRAMLDGESSYSWVVAVPEDAEIRLVAEFDGREISIDPYDQVMKSFDGDVYEGALPHLTDHHCAPYQGVRASQGAEFSGGECQVEVLDPVPWFQPAGSTGWAPAGSKWVLARVTLEINGYFSGDHQGQYVRRQTEYGEPTYTLDGKAPRAMFDGDFNQIQSRTDDMTVYDTRWLLFRVADDTDDATLRLRLTYSGVPEDSGSGAPRVDYTLKRAIDVRFT